MRQVFKQWRQRARRENREVKAGEVPFFHSLQGKYVATYLLLVVAIVLVLNTYPLIMAQNMVFSAKEASLKRQALAIGSALAVSEVLTEDGVAQAMELLDDMQGTRVLVTNESGLILYDSSTLEKRTGDYAITRGRSAPVWPSPRCTVVSPWGRCTSMNTTRSRRRCCCPSSPPCGTSPW